MQILRVGICGCTSRFHGAFRNCALNVLPKGRIGVRPIRFRLVEAVIPEKGDEREALRRLRCHFFLDQHTLVGFKLPLETTLTRNRLVSNGANRPKFYMANGFGRIGLSQLWETRRSPSVRTILDAMQAMLEQWDASQLGRWLHDMKRFV
ncbi:hypothetical protein C4553_00710 [Candidatus Parcubacteria bacterium]|nr:MAG: hypothetical protein C4553_00710 [Candidatus Parcubacteria bacterium]